MTDLRAAAQQALEALEDMLGWQSLAPQTIQEAAKGRAASLRAALAEPVQEPVAWRYVPSDVWGEPIVTQDPRTVELARQYGRPIEPLYTAPPQRKPLTEEEPVVNQQLTTEPVAWIHTDPDKPRVKFLEWRENEPGYRGDWIKTPLYIAPPQRTAEPVQEPVAWRYQDARGNYRYRGYVQGFDKEYSLLKPVPLYTAPPQRKPLTEQEIWDAVQHGVVGGIGLPSKAIAVARAVEQAHGIKE